jgi:hypothetical protein
LLLRPVSLRLLKLLQVLPDPLHLVSCPLRASSHLLDSVGDRHLHKHHNVLFMQKISPSKLKTR